jgi:hypothetical protein
MGAIFGAGGGAASRGAVEDTPPGGNVEDVADDMGADEKAALQSQVGEVPQAPTGEAPAAPEPMAMSPAEEIVARRRAELEGTEAVPSPQEELPLQVSTPVLDRYFEKPSNVSQPELIKEAKRVGANIKGKQGSKEQIAQAIRDHLQQPPAPQETYQTIGGAVAGTAPLSVPEEPAAATVPLTQPDLFGEEAQEGVEVPEAQGELPLQEGEAEAPEEAPIEQGVLFPTQEQAQEEAAFQATLRQMDQREAGPTPMFPGSIERTRGGPEGETVAVSGQMRPQMRGRKAPEKKETEPYNTELEKVLTDIRTRIETAPDELPLSDELMTRLDYAMPAMGQERGERRQTRPGKTRSSQLKWLASVFGVEMQAYAGAKPESRIVNALEGGKEFTWRQLHNAAKAMGISESAEQLSAFKRRMDEDMDFVRKDLLDTLVGEGTAARPEFKRIARAAKALGLVTEKDKSESNKALAQAVLASVRRQQSELAAYEEKREERPRPEVKPKTTAEQGEEIRKRVERKPKWKSKVEKRRKEVKETKAKLAQNVVKASLSKKASPESATKVVRAFVNGLHRLYAGKGKDRAPMSGAVMFKNYLQSASANVREGFIRLLRINGERVPHNIGAEKLYERLVKSFDLVTTQAFKTSGYRDELTQEFLESQYQNMEDAEGVVTRDDASAIYSWAVQAMGYKAGELSLAEGSWLIRQSKDLTRLAEDIEAEMERLRLDYTLAKTTPEGRRGELSEIEEHRTRLKQEADQLRRLSKLYKELAKANDGVAVVELPTAAFEPYTAFISEDYLSKAERDQLRAEAKEEAEALTEGVQRSFRTIAKAINLSNISTTTGNLYRTGKKKEGPKKRRVRREMTAEDFFYADKVFEAIQGKIRNRQAIRGLEKIGADVSKATPSELRHAIKSAHPLLVKMKLLPKSSDLVELQRVARQVYLHREGVAEARREGVPAGKRTAKRSYTTETGKKVTLTAQTLDGKQRSWAAGLVAHIDQLIGEANEILGENFLATSYPILGQLRDLSPVLARASRGALIEVNKKPVALNLFDIDQQLTEARKELARASQEKTAVIGVREATRTVERPTSKPVSVRINRARRNPRPEGQLRKEIAALKQVVDQLVAQVKKDRTDPIRGMQQTAQISWDDQAVETAIGFLAATGEIADENIAVSNIDSQMMVDAGIPSYYAKYYSPHSGDAVAGKARVFYAQRILKSLEGDFDPAVAEVLLEQVEDLVAETKVYFPNVLASYKKQKGGKGAKFVKKSAEEAISKREGTTERVARSEAAESMTAESQVRKRVAKEVDKYWKTKLGHRANEKLSKEDIEIFNDSFGKPVLKEGATWLDYTRATDAYIKQFNDSLQKAYEAAREQVAPALDEAVEPPTDWRQTRAKGRTKDVGATEETAATRYIDEIMYGPRVQYDAKGMPTEAQTGKGSPFVPLKGRLKWNFRLNTATPQFLYRSYATFGESLREVIDKGGRLDLNSLLAKAARHIDNSLAREIASRLIRSGEWVEVRTGTLPEGQIAELTGTGIVIDLKQVDAQGEQANAVLGHALMHEAAHVATIKEIMTNPEVRARMEALMNAMKTVSEAYGVTDVYEFVAEAFSNPKFQQEMARTRTEGGKVAPTRRGTLWAKFVRLVNRILKPLGFSKEKYEFETVAESFMLQRDMAVNPSKWMDTAMERAFALKMGLGRPGPKGVIEAYDTGVSEGVANGVRNAASKVGSAVIEEGQGLLTRDQIVEVYEKDFVTEEGRNLLKEYETAEGHKWGTIHNAQLKAEQIVRDWRKMSGEAIQRLSTVMMNATMYQMHPDKKLTDEANAHLTSPEQKRVFANLQKRWESLPAEEKALYQRVRDHLELVWQQEREAMTQNVFDAYGINNMTAAEFWNLVDNTEKTKGDVLAELERPNKAGESTTLSTQAKNGIRALIAIRKQERGPYFPLKRTGEYVVTASRKPETRVVTGVTKTDLSANVTDFKAEVEASIPGAFIEEKMNPDGLSVTLTITPKEVYMVETTREARALVEALKKEGDIESVSEPSLKQEYFKKRDNLTWGMLQDLEGQIKHKPTMDAMKEFYLSRLPDTSFAKAQMRRQRIVGAQMDMLKSFSQYSKSGAYHYGQLRHGKEVAGAIAGMKDLVNKDRGALNRLRRSRVVTELEKRDTGEVRRVEGGKWTDLGLAAGFLGVLVSPAYVMINSTQVPMYTIPYLTAQGYSSASVSSAMAKAYGVVGPKFLSGSLGAGLGLRSLTRSFYSDEAFSIDTVIEKLEAQGKGTQAALIRRLINTGLLDQTFSQSLRTVGESGYERGGFERLFDAARTMPHMVEVMNRTVTALMAAELASDQSFEEQVELATRAIRRSQFDYSSSNKPRWFSRETSRLLPLITQFKMHGQQVSYLVLRNFMQFFNGAPKAEKVRAAKYLLWMASTHAAAAGSMGVMFQPFKWMMMAAFALVQELDDDEIAPRSLEQAVNDFWTDFFGGNEFWSEVATYGLTRAIGVETSLRMGLQGALTMEPRSNFGDKNWFTDLLLVLGGPLMTTGNNAWRGFTQVMEGDIARGMGNMMPKMLRDFMTTYRENLSGGGITDSYGYQLVPPEDLGMSGAVTQALGFQPSLKANMYRQRDQVRRRGRNLEDQKSKLVKEFATATTWQEKRDARKAIRTHNQEVTAYFREKNVPRWAYKDYLISMSRAVQSQSRRRKKQKDFEGGLTREQRRAWSD